jgi:hypothetical protein
MRRRLTRRVKPLVLWLLDWTLSRLRVRVRYQCGHLDNRRLSVSLWRHELGVKSDPSLERKRCGMCEVSHLEAVSCRCAVPECGEPILPGNAICVVVPGDWEPAPWARRVGYSVVLGACCGSGSDHSGNWGYGRYSPANLKRIADEEATA